MQELKTAQKKSRCVNVLMTIALTIRSNCNFTTAPLNDLLIKNRYLDAIKHISWIGTLLTAWTEILIVPEHACASCLLFQI